MSQPRTDNRPGISVAEAAKRLGVSKGTVRHYVDNHLAFLAGDQDARQPRLKGWRLPGGASAARRVDAEDCERLRRESSGESSGAQTAA